MPPFRLLLVEDNPGDVRLISEALRDFNIDVRVSTAVDGQQAIDELRDSGPVDFVLLDWNLPRKSGREVLREIRLDPKLTHIPVVVFSSSEARTDIEAAYALHANSYLTKPATFDELCDIFQRLTAFWFNCAKLPGQLARM